MVFSAKGLLLNREGAKDPRTICRSSGAGAKRAFGWFVLILEEGSESEQTKPSGG